MRRFGADRSQIAGIGNQYHPSVEGTAATQMPAHRSPADAYTSEQVLPPFSLDAGLNVIQQDLITPQSRFGSLEVPEMTTLTSSPSQLPAAPTGQEAPALPRFGNSTAEQPLAGQPGQPLLASAFNAVKSLARGFQQRSAASEVGYNRMQSRRGRSPTRPESMPPGYLQGALATPFTTMPCASSFAPPQVIGTSCLNPPEQPTMTSHHNDDDVHSASPAPSSAPVNFVPQGSATWPSTPMPMSPPPGLSAARPKSLQLPASLPKSFCPPGSVPAADLQVSRPPIQSNVMSNVPAFVPKNSSAQRVWGTGACKGMVSPQAAILAQDVSQQAILAHQQSLSLIHI